MRKISYRSYLLEKPLMVNGREFTVLTISSHYEKNHGSYITDEIIKAIIQQLDGKQFAPHRQKQITDNPNEYWQNFNYEPLFYNGKAYRLV
jgi:hypothetical protein